MFKPIAMIRSPFTQRFGIPRQAGLAKSVRAEIVFISNSSTRASLQGIEIYSHLWVIFQFHEKWLPCTTVRPPRKGGKARIGVLATRSPHRPNPIGLSCIRLEKITFSKKEIVLLVSGGDFLDGTPVLDIKPYLPYCDSVNDAYLNEPEFQNGGLPETEIQWGPQVTGQLDQQLIENISEILRLDPRPRSQDKKQSFGFRFGNLNIRWRMVSAQKIEVTEIRRCTEP